MYFVVILQQKHTSEYIQERSQLISIWSFYLSGFFLVHVVANIALIALPYPNFTCPPPCPLKIPI